MEKGSCCAFVCTNQNLAILYLCLVRVLGGLLAYITREMLLPVKSDKTMHTQSR